MPRRSTLFAAIYAAAIGISCLYAHQAALAQQDALGIAEYTERGELLFPADTASWIHLGSSLGADYSAEEFDAANPGVIGVVQMEPAAYRYFLEHSEYANGTMLLLSFYPARSASDPELRGFVQGELLQQEIHVIDRERFSEEGRAFFLFRTASDRATAIAPGSECFACHSEHGAYDATFTQFYPTLRDLSTESRN